METTESKNSFKVIVDDNFHFQDESERYEHGEYGTYEEAVAACKAIVDGNLRNMHGEGESSASLFDQYTSFGDDPFIRPAQQGERFSARDYARQRCEEIYSPINLHS